MRQAEYKMTVKNVRNIFFYNSPLTPSQSENGLIFGQSWDIEVQVGVWECPAR
jgi:hypothetical protein